MKCRERENAVRVNCLVYEGKHCISLETIHETFYKKLISWIERTWIFAWLFMANDTSAKSTAGSLKQQVYAGSEVIQDHCDPYWTSVIVDRLNSRDNWERNLLGMWVETIFGLLSFCLLLLSFADYLDWRMFETRFHDIMWICCYTIFMYSLLLQPPTLGRTQTRVVGMGG